MTEEEESIKYALCSRRLTLNSTVVAVCYCIHLYYRPMRGPKGLSNSLNSALTDCLGFTCCKFSGKVHNLLSKGGFSLMDCL
jgi:hypothetical protein